MQELIKANEHYKNEMDWLTTYHHFSFGEYYNPEKHDYGPLRVFNDDTIKAGTGFEFHQHRDMEIVTYVIDGALRHRDNLGNDGIIEAGEMQRMTAGTGVFHSEYNASKTNPLRLLQMWVFPDKKGLRPSWQQKKYTQEDRKNKLLQVIGPINNSGSELSIHQNALFYLSSLDSGKKVEHILESGRKAYLFVIDGKISMNGKIMETQDAAKIENANTVSIEAEKTTELILIDLPEKYNQ
ncbi:pirin family protein [Candidatus Nitrosotalea bavarica]|uniref:pirin family protein n=1 Tax=Candidatus Nitrosotalea bavarica TaxID=1903277 RepID=UPI000C70124C|nr:pirin family protein [Candidatus Nitrosotalea bavarica]